MKLGQVVYCHLSNFSAAAVGCSLSPFSRSELIQLKEVVGPYAYLCGTNVNNVIHSSPVYLTSVHTTASIPIGDDFDKNMILKAITVVD